MAEEILASVQVRRDNKANWEAVNPILLDGEAAYEKDTDMFKIGDGVNNYKNLPYHNKVGPKGDTGATPQISMSVSTGAAGSEASVSVSGTAENPLISLTIPRGDTGASGVTEETDPTVPEWAKQPRKPTYTASEVGARPDTWMPSAADVGADAAGTASAQVGAHNVSGAAHADMRALIEGLTSRLNALADSDDTTLDQLSEIVAYIKSNKALIDAVTTGKVSTGDIVDNLTTNASGKVLSAAQGVALKGLIDAIVIPDKLPNPQPLTINGQSYDGSSAVEVNVTGEGAGVEVDNTLTQYGKAADAGAVGNALAQETAAREAAVNSLNQANAQQNERLNTLEQNTPSGTSGLTVAQVNALDGMFKIAAYTEDASSAYAAFKSAFGLSENISATGITLSENVISFADSNPITLTATVTPSNSTDAVVWQSDDVGVATVENGVVTPVADGNCTITATSGSVSATCAVTVDLPNAVTYTVTNNLTGYNTDNEAATVAENGSYRATLTVTDGYTSQSVTITMGGVDITETAWQDGMVLINGVTGDIVITAVASVLTVLAIDDTASAGTAVDFYSSADATTKLKTMFYAKFAMTKLPAYEDTVLTVNVKNETGADVSVDEIYAGMLKASDTTNRGSIKVYNSSLAKKVAYKLTPGDAVEFTCALSTGYHLLINRVDGLTYTISGDLGTPPALQTYDVAYKKHGGGTDWYSSEDETTKLISSYYPPIWYTTNSFAENTDLIITVVSDTAGGSEGLAGTTVSDPNGSLPNKFYNAVDLWSGNMNSGSPYAGIPVTVTYMVKAGNYLCLHAAEHANVTIAKAVS